MQTKKLLFLSLVFALVTVSGCKETNQSNQPTQPEPTEETPEKQTEPVKPVMDEEKKAEAPKEEAPPAPPKVWTAEESDPSNFNWMQGFPPPKDRILSAADHSFFKFPALRYSVCHMRQFFPTTDVPSAQEKRYSFESYLDNQIDDLTFTPTGEETPITWKESLLKNFTDGIIILHKGNIIYEKYFGALNKEGIHALMSLTKTFTGTLAEALIADGTLDENKLVTDYIPELARSGFAGATVRNVLDMTTAIKYSEDYANPNAEIWSYSSAGSPFPKPANYKGPRNYYEALESLQKDGEHGEVFAYRTPNADLAGWLISVVTQKPIAEVLDERIWHPIGADHAAYYQIDSAGIAFAGGGLNANLRDVAKFGQMILNDGRFNGKQVLPEAVIKDIKENGDKEAFAKSAYTSLKGWSYRNMWWKTNNKDNAFMGRGVHGQSLYIDPKAEMVIVRFASHPKAANGANDPTTLPAYQAVADYLIAKNPLYEGPAVAEAAEEINPTDAEAAPEQPGQPAAQPGQPAAQPGQPAAQPGQQPGQDANNGTPQGQEAQVQGGTEEPSAQPGANGEQN